MAFNYSSAPFASETPFDYQPPQSSYIAGLYSQPQPPYTTALPESLGYHTVESVLEDISKQIASSNITRRHSRGSGQRAGGLMNRVVKPSSTSNSPRGPMTLSRRRTVMGDGSYQRRPAAVDQTNMSVAPAYAELQESAQPRPVSWHPTSCLPQQVSTPFDNYIPRLEVNDGFGAYELPPTPAVYSGYATPASAFSPFPGYDQPCPAMEEASFFPSDSVYQSSTLNQQIEPQGLSQNATDASLFNHYASGNASINYFNSTTAPPTPESFPSNDQMQATFPAHGIIYPDLEDSEDSGEVLVGMGLYDEPEKSSGGEPLLDNYRALMMQQLIEAGHRKAEPTGKGLKLEEAWVPTASDEDEDGSDEDEDEDEDGRTDEVKDDRANEDEDAEGSPAAEEPVDTASQCADVSNNFTAVYNSQAHAANVGHFLPEEAPALYSGQQYFQRSWDEPIIPTQTADMSSNLSTGQQLAYQQLDLWRWP